MASQDHIRNPIEWGWDQISLAALSVGSLGRSLRGSEESQRGPLPAVARALVGDVARAVRIEGRRLAKARVIILVADKAALGGVFGLGRRLFHVIRKGIGHAASF